MRTLTDIMTALLKTVKLVAHPVGSIYISTVETSPEELFGGTWEQVQDTFLWCAGTNHPAGSTGGEETHTLSVSEMPRHGHTTRIWINQGSTAQAKGCDDGINYNDITAGLQLPSGSGSWVTPPYAAGNGYGDKCGNTLQVGDGAAHNNMPPYLAVYAWKRVA